MSQILPEQNPISVTPKPAIGILQSNSHIVMAPGDVGNEHLF